MLSRQEYNDLYRLFERYNDAWEAYVQAVWDNRPERYGLGAAVGSAKEELISHLKSLV